MNISNIDLTCVICLDIIKEFKDKKTLSCEHMFHNTCYIEYNNNTCPICKKENYNIIIDNIYMDPPPPYTLFSPINNNRNRHMIRQRILQNNRNIRPPWRY
jgi:hypothetical protein